MTSSLKILAAAVMLAGFAAPASAASWQPQPAQVQNAQFEFNRGGDGNRRGSDRFERRGNSYYFNGHRGSRERRSGWRNYNGYWFPQSAFSFSITIGGDRGRDRGGARLTRAHIEWCEDNYRSYRVSDNSFQPYNGPRRSCVSPYRR